MTDEEKNLLETTKQLFNTEKPQEQTVAKSEKVNKDIDVDAILKLHGLSKDTQPKTDDRRKWMILASFTVLLIVFMIAISLMLNNFSK